MAHYFCHSPCKLMMKNQFLTKKLATVLSSQRFLSSNNKNAKYEEFQLFPQSIRRVLAYSFLASGTGYLLYKWKMNFCDQSLIRRYLIPTVHAKSFIPTDISHNRDKYNFIADVVEVSAPSVVYIEIKDNKRKDFFTGEAATVSHGSGFIVAEDGLIMTNAHVVVNKPYSTVNVQLQDGSTYIAHVEDVDMKSDLATLRINKKNLPVIRLGKSATLRPGEFVVAIGSPLALSNSITSGVVSSVSRHSKELGILHTQMAYIQTDAAITFGNSGGPLVNLNGEVIGINAMKVTPGISFAIPIDYAKEFLEKAQKRRKKDKGQRDTVPKKRYMGMTLLTLTPNIIFEHQRANVIPLNVRNGVLVWKVIYGSPAHISGILSGDIITHLNGEEVHHVQQIYKVLETSEILQITFIRNGVVRIVNIKPEEID